MKTIILTAVLTSAGLFGLVDYAFSTPDVYVSYETRECVQVDNFPGVFFNTDSNYSCSNLPAKYNHIWAQ
jgi:hypothetical protein